jgi:hypothetical protein
VDDFDVEPVKGMEPFRFISARAKLGLEVPNLDAVNFLAAPGASFEIADGSGAVDVDAAIDHGVFTGDSRLAYRTGHVGVATGAAKFQVDGDLVVSAAGPTSETAAAVSLDLPSAELRFEGARAAPIGLRDVAASMASSSADVTLPWSIARANGALTAVFEDLRSVGDVPGARAAPVKVRRGSGEARVALTMNEEHVIEGTLDAHARRIRVCHASGACFEAPTLALSGDGTSRVRPQGRFRLDMTGVRGEHGLTRVTAARLSSRGSVSPSEVKARVDLKKVAVGTFGACPWTEAAAIVLDGRVATRSRRRIEADVRGALEGASFTWGSFRVGGPRTAFAAWWDGERLTADVRADTLDFKSSGGAPKGWQAGVGTTNVRADLSVARGRLRGPVRVDAKHVVGRVGGTDVEGDIIGALGLTSNDPSFERGDVSGVVQARGVTLRTGESVVKDYWAEVVLRDLHVDTRQNLDLNGVVEARFRDALPALYIAAAHKKVPGWLPSLLPLQSVDLDLYVERFCRWTDVQLQEGHGGPLSATGRLQLEPGDTRGALLLQLAGFGPLSIGLDFAQDASSVTPFAGRGWLEKHNAALTNAATAKHDERCKPEPASCE